MRESAPIVKHSNIWMVLVSQFRYCQYHCFYCVLIFIRRVLPMLWFGSLTLRSSHHSRVTLSTNISGKQIHLVCCLLILSEDGHSRNLMSNIQSWLAFKTTSQIHARIFTESAKFFARTLSLAFYLEYNNPYVFIEFIRLILTFHLVAGLNAQQRNTKMLHRHQNIQS